MLWLYLAIFAYFVDALAFVVDKYLIEFHVTDPFVYAFGVSILSLGALVLIPFGVFWPSLTYLIIALISGAAFFVSLIFLYKGIKISDVSVMATNVGAMSAIFTYFFSFFVLKDSFSVIHFLAFVLLVTGLFFLGKAEKGIFKFAVISGLLMGLSFVLMKWNFNHAGFVNGIFWTRIGFIGGGLVSIINKNIRHKVLASLKGTRKSTKFIFIFNKVLAGVGFLIMYYAIRLGNVSLVNALLGFQFVFVFLIALIFKKKIGIHENLRRPILIHKILGIIFVFTGFLVIIFK